MHSIILDSTNDLDDWVAILARFVGSDGKSPLLWDLVCMQDNKTSTFSKPSRTYTKDTMSISRKSSAGRQTGRNNVQSSERLSGESRNIYHCGALLGPPIDLAMSTDVWESSDLCRQIQEAPVTSYNMLNRSSQQRKDFRGWLVSLAK